jgi:hypothetical protein
MRRVVERATEEIVRNALAAIEQTMGEDGQVYGDRPVSGQDVLARYLYLQDYEWTDPATGIVHQHLNALPFLRVVSPRFADKLDREAQVAFARLVQ